MREIHPFNISVEEAMRQVPEMAPVVTEVRRQKNSGERKKPSDSLIDKSAILTDSQRKLLIDKVAEFVDENYCGRSEMCQQFADLMHRALVHLGFNSRVAIGSVTYYDGAGSSIFRWPQDGHDWVVVNDEIIDGNVDSLYENKMVPAQVQAKPYWGPRSACPRDRKFNENPGARTREPDVDVERFWWPELKSWIDQTLV